MGPTSGCLTILTKNFLGTLRELLVGLPWTGIATIDAQPTIPYQYRLIHPNSLRAWGSGISLNVKIFHWRFFVEDSLSEGTLDLPKTVCWTSSHIPRMQKALTDLSQVFRKTISIDRLAARWHRESFSHTCNWSCNKSRM